MIPLTHQNGGASESIRATDICGRCLFRNHCLTIRLLGLPRGRDVRACFAGCSGLLMVTHGQLELETAGVHRVVREGETWTLPADGAFRLWADDTTDVVFFERSVRGGVAA